MKKFSKLAQAKRRFKKTKLGRVLRLIRRPLKKMWLMHDRIQASWAQEDPVGYGEHVSRQWRY